jgi:protein phosphatase
MATTFTGLWFGDGGLLLAHTGDSRAICSFGTLTRQTRDDSFVQVLVDRGW